MPWKQPAADDELLGRGLDVQDARAGGHPLRAAVEDPAATAVGVLVLDDPVDHVGDGLEPAVRVPRRAERLTRAVVDRPHLVHVDERVESRRVHAGEGPTHGEALALEPRGRRRDRHHVAGAAVGSGASDPGQAEWIGGHRRHGSLPRSGPPRSADHLIRQLLSNQHLGEPGDRASVFPTGERSAGV